MTEFGAYLVDPSDYLFYKRLSENYIFHLIRLSSKWIMAI